MSRFYANPYISGSKTIPTVDAIKTTIKDRYTSAIIKLGNYLHVSLDTVDQRDLSIYTGISGIAFLGMKIQNDAELLRNPDIRNLVKALDDLKNTAYENRENGKLSGRISAFTSNYTAPCLIKALSKSASSEGALRRFNGCIDYIKNQMPDEALYGRVGYLSGVLAILKDGQLVDENAISKAVELVLQSGRSLSKDLAAHHKDYDAMVKPMEHASDLPPLMYSWHDKFYLGAAHGYAGILQVLLKIHERLPQCLPPDALEKEILPTVRWLARLQFSSGNWPSSLGSSAHNDRLVQWCHGAPGVVPLMLNAYKLTGDREYLERAERGGEVIWERGLLTKGCGLCHGSAGNGYALLTLYQHTGKEKYLQRAAAFALWCTKYFKHAERMPDRPLSLFEGVPLTLQYFTSMGFVIYHIKFFHQLGLAGAICFLVDMRDPENAEFPLIN